MADPVPNPDAPAKKAGKRPLLIGVALAVLLGGAGFYAVYSGLVLGPTPERMAAEHAPEGLPDIAFVPVDPVTISLGPAATAGHLRMTAQLEVAKPHAADVTMLMPRILDVLNGYLRAVEVAQLEDPTALVRLRAQMLRRVQTVVGEGRVRDLLITEFVLN